MKKRSKKAESLYCWRQFQKWHKRAAKADDKAVYWIKRKSAADLF